MKQNNRLFFKRINISIFVLVSIYFIGIIGYMFIEEMPFLDAVFMTTITITTVGYSLIKNLSKAGTIFTIFLIIFGTGTAAYILVNLADFILSEFILGIFQYRRLKKMISKLKNHYIICGFGRVGQEIAKELIKEKADFVVIERADEPIELCKQNNWLFLQGDATEDDMLIQAGIKNAKSLFAALDNESDNVYITLSAKNLNPSIFIVARAKNYSTISKLERAGADRIVSPQIIGGKRMAALARQPTIVEFLDTLLSPENVEITMAEIMVEPRCKIDGLTIKEASEKFQFDALIISIIESGKKILVNKANANTVIKAGNKLIAVGTVDQIENLSKLSTST